MRIFSKSFVKLSVQELRIVYCQTGETSKGVREYVQKYYPILKKANPEVSLMIRECSGIKPRLWARYASGRETSVPLSNQSAPDIAKQVEAVGK